MATHPEFVARALSPFFSRSLESLERRAKNGEEVQSLLAELVAAPVTTTTLELLFKRYLPASAGGTEPPDGDAVSTGLRRVRLWVLLALIERDCRGAASLDEVCQAMSGLAIQASAVAMRSAGTEMLARYGPALDASGRVQDLLAVAMGKGGGNELNVSSDLDLVFVFREEGESAGVIEDDGRVRPGSRIASSEWMHRAARRTIELLAENTAEGFVFRVDTRLRPNGDSGPLVASLGMLEQYFFAQGREWERFAWLKARVIASSGQSPPSAVVDDEQGLMTIVTPFVFRRYLDYAAIAALRDLHGKIRAEVSRRSARDPEALDVKLGRGGIREIEFTAQLFQIVRGGRDPGLRSRRTLETLATLARRGVIDAHDAQALADAYQLLRRTEHALQYREDAQTHRLPHEQEARLPIAAMLRMSPEAFDTAIEQATQRVAAVFERLLAPVDAPAAVESNEAPAAPNDDPEILRRLEQLRAGSRYAAARAETRQSIERLIAHARSARLGVAGMIRLIDLLESVCRRPAYVALLAQYPQAFDRVLKVLDWAKWPADYLMKHPVVLDELLDGQLLAPTDTASWAEQLEERVFGARMGADPDIELQMDLVREAHHAQVFRLMVQDLGGLHSTERISDFLSELADRVLDLVIRLVWSQLRQRFRDSPRVAVIAYGRLGGKELGYASDLDLVFVHDDDDERATEAYSILAQRVSGWLSTRTAAGLLFETDLRLRPNGNAGLLACSLEGFERYQRESAWVWEHQALTRARFAAGDPEIGQRFETVRRQVLATPRDPQTLAAEVRAMRQKMHDGHPNRSDQFDLKHDEGGMVDIEFIVQFLVLAHAREQPLLLDNAGNIALLNRAAAAGLIDATLAVRVADAYRRYRQLQHQLRLDDAQFARVDAESVRDEVGAVRELWARVLGV
jgi:glutamate-ammonia-ligase adenylyltransferase